MFAHFLFKFQRNLPTSFTRMTPKTCTFYDLQYEQTPTGNRYETVLLVC